jgi:hypothetical protein
MRSIKPKRRMVTIMLRDLQFLKHYALEGLHNEMGQMMWDSSHDREEYMAWYKKARRYMKAIGGKTKS